MPIPDLSPALILSKYWYDTYLKYVYEGVNKYQCNKYHLPNYTSLDYVKCAFYKWYVNVWDGIHISHFFILFDLRPEIFRVSGNTRLIIKFSTKNICILHICNKLKFCPEKKRDNSIPVAKIRRKFFNFEATFENIFL